MKDKILLVTLTIFLVSFFSYAGYQSGYTHGERNGYSDGEKAAWSYYPKMSTDSIVIEKDGNKIELDGLTIIGEQHILDIISGNSNSLGNWK